MNFFSIIVNDFIRQFNLFVLMLNLIDFPILNN